MAKIALLIGVSDYEAGLPSLPGTQADIRAMQRVLTSRMGEFDDVQLLSNPDSTQMHVAIESLFLEDRHKDDLILLYISGHGYRDEEGYLHFVSSTTQLRKTPGQIFTSTAVAASSIHKYMSGSRSRHQILILDCCFSGAFAEGMQAKSAEQPIAIREQLGGEGRVVLTSSTATQQSYAEEDASIYTRYLVEGIETGAADINNDGVITTDELHQYAKRRTQEAAPAMKPEIFPVQEGYAIELAKAPQKEPKLQYRKEVERCVRDGEVSIIGRKILTRLREDLRLSSEEAIAIENEVLEPFRIYQRNLQEYQQTFAEVMEQEGEISPQTREELKWLQQLLKLRDEDIIPIEQTILSSSTPKTNQHEPNQPSTRKPEHILLRELSPQATIGVVTLLFVGTMAGVFIMQQKIDSWLSFAGVDAPTGEFQYAGSTAWAFLRCEGGIDDQIQAAQPNFQLRTDSPNSILRNSGDGIVQLTNGTVDFAVSSRPLTATEKEANLEEIPVAQDVLTFIVNANLPDTVAGLTLQDLVNIYTSRIDNWNAIAAGGTDLPIIPYVHEAERSAVYSFQQEVLGGVSFGSTVVDVESATEAIRLVSANPGGIYRAPASQVYSQRDIGVKPIPVGRSRDRLTLPFAESFNPNDICGNVRSNDAEPTPLLAGYPEALRETMYVIVKDDNSIQEQAGRAYAAFLLTDEGQKLMQQIGFQPMPDPSFLTMPNP
jgi:ABC-type phosphate transport system substrate-binding protein/uncharacterized caspase-like protein